jgi:membrane protein DedA with SNARE-associated domain
MHLYTHIYIGSMKYKEFALYNIGGALLWTFLFVGAGFFFGNIPAVQHNFTLVVLAIVLVSVIHRYLCMYVCMYVCIYVYIYTYTYIYTHIYIHIYICMYVYIHM